MGAFSRFEMENLTALPAPGSRFEHDAGVVLWVARSANSVDDAIVMTGSSTGYRLLLLKDVPRLLILAGSPEENIPDSLNGVFLSPRVCRRECEPRELNPGQEDTRIVTSEPLPMFEVVVRHPYLYSETPTAPLATAPLSDVVKRVLVCTGIGSSSRLFVRAAAAPGELQEIAWSSVRAVNGALPVGDVRQPMAKFLRFHNEPAALEMCVKVERLCGVHATPYPLLCLFSELSNVPLLNVASTLLFCKEFVDSRVPNVVRSILKAAYEQAVAVYEGGAAAPLRGAQNMEPLSCVIHTTPTVCMDVSSMYPSLIVRDNICVAGVGVLPRVAKRLIEFRRDPSTPPDLRSVSKLLVNSMYGMCACTSQLDSFPWVNVYAMGRVTGGGRSAMQEMRRMATEEGGVVVGDITDSIFVTDLPAGAQEVLQERVRSELDLELRVDGEFSRFLMVHQQAWVGLDKSPLRALRMKNLCSMAEADVALVEMVLRCLLLGDAAGARTMARGSVPRPILQLVHRPMCYGALPRGREGVYDASYLDR